MVLAVLPVTAAEMPAREPAVGAAPAGRDVRSILQAWREAEALAATIPASEVVIGRGDSMLPVYPDSTVMVVRRMRLEELSAGMVVVFIGDRGRPVAHELVANGPRGWSAKGMGNADVDRTRVRAHNYLGTVVRAFVPTGVGSASDTPAARPTASE
jgi:hypothetical protein